jgi:hypothetical protein
MFDITFIIKLRNTMYLWLHHPQMNDSLTFFFTINDYRSRCLTMMIDWLIIYCFTSRSRIFHLYGDVTIAGEGLQNLGLCSALRAFEQGGIFIVPHLLWHGTSVFPVSSEGPPRSVASYDTHGDAEDVYDENTYYRIACETAYSDWYQTWVRD